MSARQPIAYQHIIHEPDGRVRQIYSSEPVNPWSHWLGTYLGLCQYHCHPLIGVDAVSSPELALFESHYWDSLEPQKALILQHVRSIFLISAAKESKMSGEKVEHVTAEVGEMFNELVSSATPEDSHKFAKKIGQLMDAKIEAREEHHKTQVDHDKASHR